MTNQVLRADSLCKQFQTSDNRVVAVDAVSLSATAGEVLAIHGPSGSGKSTLLMMLGGLLNPDSGSVNIAGSDPYALSNSAQGEFRAKNVGFVFQQFLLLPYLTARQNVCVPQLAHSAGDTEARATELLTYLKLGDRLSHKPSALSVGEQQRVALARAVVSNPKIILADEPTGNLDAESAELVLDYFAKFASEGGAVIMVSHDDKAIQSATRRIELKDGTLKA